MRSKAPWSWRSRTALLSLGAGVAVLATIGVALVVLRPGAKTVGAQHSSVIQAHPFTVSLGVAGVIAPGDTVAIVAPFDGKVNRVGFEFGGPVLQGQTLVELDAGEIQQRLDEAETEYLRAAQAAAALDNWSAGPEVSQAKRAESQAALDLADTTRKIAETRTLLDRGLVARDELDGLLQQQRGQESSLAAARQDLTDALKRGEGSNRRVIEIELSLAKARLDEIQAQVAGATVRAPTAGIAVRPQSDKAESSVPVLHAGATLARGQLIAAIARQDSLAVSFQLSEADANRVRPGQRVEVSGPGFEGYTLTGSIASVAREATPASGGGGNNATFSASATLDPLTPAQAAEIRIGMTANVTIDLYRNPSALTAPPAAVQGTAPDTYVMVRNPYTGETRATPVRIGQVAADGVEILSGLKAGDTVVWTGDGPRPDDAS